MEIGNTAVTLNIQFRVEELRLYLWGRSWGLAIELESNEKSNNAKDDAEPDGQDVEIQTSVNYLHNIDDDFDIPGLRDLTLEVLGRISKALDEWRAAGQRYGIASVGTTNVQDSSQQAIRDVKVKQRTQADEISTRTKLTSKFRWALTDKTLLEGLLTKLTSFNDSLEKLLPKREKKSISRGLAGELLNLLEAHQSTGLLHNQVNHLSQLLSKDDSKALNILELKSLNQTENGERKLQKADSVMVQSPFAGESSWSQGEKEDLRLTKSQFLKLVDPKLQYYHQQNEKGRWVSSRYVPLPRSSVVLSSAPLPSQPNAPEGPAEMTLIEWRPTAHESRASRLTEDQMKERRDHIARLLHKTSISDAEFRVLDCLGYITDVQGHTPDGTAHDLVGYVYRYPEFASTQHAPVSLRELLGEAYHSDNPKVPPLEARFKLAHCLAIALYQLQCAGWVHRKMSSKLRQSGGIASGTDSPYRLQCPFLPFIQNWSTRSQSSLPCRMAVLKTR